MTIDAMGCQTAITEKIIEGKGDYIIALKANQKHSLNLAKNMISGFANRERRNIVSRCSTTNEGHGRHEQRDCIVVSYGNIMQNMFKDKFIGLKSIVGITSQRTIIATGETTEEVRYYITSLSNKDPEKLRMLSDNIGLLKTICIGNWTLPSERMTVGKLEMLLEISLL